MQASSWVTPYAVRASEMSLHSLPWASQPDTYFAGQTEDEPCAGRTSPHYHPYPQPKLTKQAYVGPSACKKFSFSSKDWSHHSLQTKTSKNRLAIQNIGQIILILTSF